MSENNPSDFIDNTDRILDNVIFIDNLPSNLGVTEMANNPDGDLSNDSLELLLEQDMSAHDVMMQEHRGNAESAHSIVRHSGARKFNQEDPIEAAATEMILQKNGE